MSTTADTLPAKGKLSSLRYLWRYILPYKRQAMGASVALVFTSLGVLGMGTALGHLIDKALPKVTSTCLVKAISFCLGSSSHSRLAPTPATSWYRG